MTGLDKLICEVIDRRTDRDLDGITRDVETDLTQELRKALTPSPAAILYRLIRKRVRKILRHDPRQALLPGLQNHYPTHVKAAEWIRLKDMSFATAMVNLDRKDRKRRSAEAEYAALKDWIIQTYPGEARLYQARLLREAEELEALAAAKEERR